MDAKASKRSPKPPLASATRKGTEGGKSRSGSAKPTAQSRTTSSKSPREPSARKRSSQASRSPSSAARTTSTSTPRASVSKSSLRLAARLGSSDGFSTASSNAQNPAAPSPITAAALASINYAGLTQAAIPLKQRRARMLRDFLAAHRTGAQRIADECETEHQALWRSYVQDSHTLQGREIRRLLRYTDAVRSDSQQRLQHAESLTRCALDGIAQVLLHLTEAGSGILTQTGVLLSGYDAAPSRNAEMQVSKGADAVPATAERGTPMPEVRGFDPAEPDPHPPAFRSAEADWAECARLQGIFQRAVDSIGAFGEQDGTAANSAFSPLSPVLSISPTERANVETTEATVVASSTTMPPDGEDGSLLDGSAARADTQQRLGFSAPAAAVTGLTADDDKMQQVEMLNQELSQVGAAFVSLMARVDAQHQAYLQKIAAQREALDMAATRTKLADDVLRDTVAQGEIEASSAVAAVQQLSVELRHRIDVSEARVSAALDALLKESAEVCVNNDALHNYATLTLNKENCLCAYVTRMERQVLEQADVLRQAQDAVTLLWSRAHGAKHQPQHTEGEEAATAAQQRQPAGNALKRGTSEVRCLPPLYRQLLCGCDRATLLRLVEDLTQMSGDAATLVVGRLDEHAAFAATHPAEAAAAHEAHARIVATQQLLEKLDAEGRLHSNAQHTTESLSARITRLVSQYDAYMDFNEQYARALVRQADAERREHAPDTVAFFDARTPMPAAAAAATVRAASVTAGTSQLPRSYAAVASPKTAKQQATANAAPAAAEPLPYLRLWQHQQRDAQTKQNEVGAALTGSSGSEFNAAASTGHIVGFLDYSNARYGSSPAALPSATSSSALPPGMAVSGLASTAHSSSPLRSRLRTTIGASTSSYAASALPPPPVPPRAGLTSYILSTYGGGVTEAAGREGLPAVAGGGTISGRAAKPTARNPTSYRDGDRQFIERQREVFQQLD